ncbi:MAG: cell division protein ZapA [Gemmatimonadales bacterium]|jgi:cell division protein ZapA (FtsZ GTPase activity inhibitor)
MSEKSIPGLETVEIEILDETYALKSETGADYTRRVAQHVDRTAREIRDESGVLDKQTIVVLAAMAIADQLFRMRDGVEVVKGLAEKRAELLTQEVLKIVEKESGD